VRRPQAADPLILPRVSSLLLFASSDNIEDAETLQKKFIKIPCTHTPGIGKQQKPRDEIVFKNTRVVIEYPNGLRLAWVAARQQTERDRGEEGDVKNRENSNRKSLRRRLEERQDNILPIP
jgi:hypothetical protein